MFAFFKRCVCADGFSMSVQANDGAYCEPRMSGASRYLSVEVGYPSDKEPLLMLWIDGDDSDPTGNVYGYVPVTVVRQVIEKHGGLASGEVPPGV